jgi:hypothetical protein
MRLQRKSSLSREAVKTRASALDANPVSSRLALIAPSDAFDRARVAHAQRYDVPELAFVPPGVL